MLTKLLHFFQVFIKDLDIFFFFFFLSIIAGWKIARMEVICNF